MRDSNYLPLITRRTQRRFHLMAKPIGALCNLNCTYCYYLSKKDLIGSGGRMSDEVLKEYIRQTIEAQDSTEIIFSWQGGEPTLLGLDFFRKALEWERKYCPPDKYIENDLQTNGILLNDEWCEFLSHNHFLVGLSIDGPKDLHDCYRVDNNQQPSFDRVFAASRLLRKYGIQFNTLTVVNRVNAKYPLEIYRFLKHEVGSTRIQLIPLVEPKVFTKIAPQYWSEKLLPPIGSPASRPGNTDSFITDWSVDPQDYGNFLCSLFDEWYKRDIGKIFVYLFECALGQWMGMESSLCIMADICGKALAIEHDGSVYSCDHYVYPEYRIGNIKKQPLSKMIFSARQFTFGSFKSKSLPDYCRRCPYLFACNGECPRNRFLRTIDGEVGLNYLCSGLRKYLSHIDPYMKLMAGQIMKTR